MGRATGSLEVTAETRPTSASTDGASLLASALGRPADMLRRTLKTQQPKLALASDTVFRWTHGRGIDWFAAEKSAMSE